MQVCARRVWSQVVVTKGWSAKWGPDRRGFHMRREHGRGTARSRSHDTLHVRLKRRGSRCEVRENGPARDRSIEPRSACRVPSLPTGLTRKKPYRPQPRMSTNIDDESAKIDRRRKSTKIRGKSNVDENQREINEKRTTTKLNEKRTKIGQGGASTKDQRNSNVDEN